MEAATIVMIKTNWEQELAHENFSTLMLLVKGDDSYEG